MRIAICDDNPRDAALLRCIVEEYLQQGQYRGSVEVFSGSGAFLRTFRAGVYQIIFMDIYMHPGEPGGIDTAKSIRTLDENCSIVFTTVSDLHGVESYKVRATHYITKPLRYKQVEEALERCQNQLNRFAKSIELVVNRTPIKVNLHSLLYVEAYGRYSIFHTENESYKTLMPLTAAEEIVADGDFVRCHRSYLINIPKVIQLREKALILKGEVTIPIGGAYMEQLRQAHIAFVTTMGRSYGPV